MNTQTYEKLLNELGIPFEWSLEDREALLETEFNKALDRINAVQQSGDMVKIKQLQKRADELGDAIDYTRELQKSLSSGIVLDTQSEKDRQKDTLKALKEAGKEKAQTLKELADVTQSASNSSAGQSASNSSTGQSATQSGNSSAGPSVTPPVSNTSATQPPVPANNANPTLQSLMRRAEMELDGENWEKAKELYDKILNADPKNVEANLGFFMANRQIREKKKIPEAARAAWKNNEDLFQDTYFLRARRYADAALKKEMDDMEKGRDYLLAIEELQRAKTSEDYKKAAGMFAKLGDFADARTKRLEAGYKQADYALRQANRIEDFLAAKKLFEDLGDYSDSKKKVQECERGIASIKDAAERKAKQQQKEKEANENYQKEYGQFEEQVTQLKEIKECKTKINSFEAAQKRLEKKARKVFDVKLRWFIIAGVLFLLCFAAPFAVERMNDAGNGRLYEYGILRALDELAGNLDSSIFIYIVVISAGIAWCVSIFTNANGFLCFIGIALGFILGIPASIAFGLFVNTHGYTKYAGIIGAVPFIAVVLLKVNAKRMKGAAAARIKKIEQLKKSIIDEYANIERIAGSEYQKLLNKYPDATNCKLVSEVQRAVRKKVGG